MACQLDIPMISDLNMKDFQREARQPCDPQQPTVGLEAYITVQTDTISESTGLIKNEDSQTLIRFVSMTA